MNIKMIGIDHKMADVTKREVFSFTKRTAVLAMQQICEKKGIFGCVILSTCNRMEVYVSCGEDMEESLVDFLCEIREVDREAYQNFFIAREGQTAVRHLFSLAAGLESQIFGEDQILSQVKAALAMARENECTDKVLEVLFRKAVTSGKKVKTNVPVAKANFSAAHQALSALERQGTTVAGKRCLVIGNGEMGKITSNLLREKGAKVTVTVRQYKSGVVEIPEGCERINYAQRYELMTECDLVFSATASPNVTIRVQEVAKFAGAREQIYIDLAVPRDIDPEIGKLAGVTVYDIDSFKISAVSVEMQEQMQQAKQILEEGIEEYRTWYECRDLLPRVQNIAREAARDAVWRSGRKIAELSLPEDGKQELCSAMEQSVQKVMEKHLFLLRDELEPAQFRECLDVLDQLEEKTT